MRAHPLRLALRLALPLPLAWGLAHAQSAVVPPHQIPAEVLANLQQVQLTFERALEQDCAPERCASKGCVYVSHKVVDQPAVGGLPGLRLQGTGPGASAGQLYLTAVHCGFVHERAVRAADARALAKRLEAKVSQGWTRVEVTAERLEALPEHLRVPPEPPPPPPPDPAPEPEAAPLPPQTWEAPRAAQELWAQLLPHFSWMIAVILLTFAALILIWAARRLGRTSPEEQLLMRQLLADEGAAQEPPPPSPLAPPPQEEGDAKALTEARLTAWRARLSEGEGPDPALEALAADLLRGGEQRLLAKAVMRFPEAFPRALPQGGELASAKLQLAEFIKAADPATLPSDEAFLDALDRYALASSLIAQPDTELMRGLHEEFGPAALTELMIALPPRFAALLFAFAPAQTQREAAATLTGPQRAEVADQLLRSSRVDTAESDYLLSVLAALRAGARLPTPPAASPVPDRGTAFGAAAALSVLLPRLDVAARAAVLDAATARARGPLPTWCDAILYAEALLNLPIEARADLLLEVDIEPLAAWLSIQHQAAREAVIEAAPVALRAALGALELPERPAAVAALAHEGHAALTTALTRHLRRQGLPLRDLLA